MLPTHTHLQKFEEHLILLNTPTRTRTSYLSSLKKFLHYCEHQKIENAISDETVKEYLLNRYEQNLDWKTINLDYSALKKYFEGACQKEWNYP